MASLIHALAFSGARDSLGAVVAGGRVYLTVPGSVNTAVTAYTSADKSSAVPLDSGGCLLDSGGRAKLYVEDPCSVRIDDQSGVTVGTFTYGGLTNDGLVEVTTPGWTGINSSGSSVSGARTYLDTVLTNLYSSLGGLDGKYRGIYGINDTNVKTEIEQISLTPQRFGAKGDGVTDDTNALLLLAAAQSASRIPVFFPKGTYLYSQAITWSPVVMRGAGSSGGGATNLIATNGTQNGFVLGLGSFISDIAFAHQSASSGTCLSCASGGFTLLDVIMTSGFATGVSAGAVSAGRLIASAVSGTTATVGTWISTASSSITGTASTGTRSGATQIASTTDITNGGSITPTVASITGLNESGVAYHRLRGTVGGGATTINPPNAPLPGSAGVLITDCFNNSAGAYTFTFAAGFKTTAAVAPGSGLHQVVTFAYNATEALWIETSRTAAF